MLQSIRFCVFAAGLLVAPLSGIAQIVIISTTSPAYTVTISVTPVSLVNIVCGSGSFTYQPSINYSVVFSPTTAPALSYINGRVVCSGAGSTFTLPVAGGAGTLLGAVTTYTGPASCASATPSTIGCTYYQINMAGAGISARSIVTSIPATALPISLLRFDARREGRDVYLIWETAAAKSAGIQLEQSTDAGNWTPSDAVVTRRNSKSSEIFETREAMPATGYRYYRLRQTGADGSHIYSNTLAVRAEADLGSAAIVPNPVTDGKFRIEGLENPSAWELSVINMASQRVFHQASGTAEIAVPNLAPGLYVLQLLNRETGAGKALRFRKD